MTEAPLSLSFPAILRNPGISDRYAHLRLEQQSTSVLTASNKLKREHNEGKKWIRRKDNARFTGNPHIVAATTQDYTLQPPHVIPTFPEPLPPFLQRNSKLPTTTLPTRDPNTANAGRFSLSLRGMRRELRKSGFRAEILVREIESRIVDWLQVGGTVLAPDGENKQGDHFVHSSGNPVGNTGTIFEISRTPLQLVWSITDDPFARYVVHCCARYHEIVSFSKELSGRRLTYLLRPNVTRPDYRAPATLDTPPVTDLDSQLDTESDKGGPEIDSDVEQRTYSLLSGISEDASAPSSPIPASSILSDTWSVVEQSDIEGDESESDASLNASLDDPPVPSEARQAPGVDNDRTPRAKHYLQQSSIRNRVWDSHHRQGSTTSSPSHSPIRGVFPRGLGPVRFDPPRSSDVRHQSFYNYLFL